MTAVSHSDEPYRYVLHIQTMSQDTCCIMSIQAISHARPKANRGLLHSVQTAHFRSSGNAVLTSPEVVAIDRTSRLIHHDVLTFMVPKKVLHIRVSQEFEHVSLTLAIQY